VAKAFFRSFGVSVMNDVYSFRWEVARNGYQWVNAELVPRHYSGGSDAANSDSAKRSGRTLLLIESLAPGAAIGYREYNPMDKPALFREFVDLRIEPNAILAFANRCGRIGVQSLDLYVGDGAQDLPGNPLPELAGRYWYGERLGNWADCILWLGRAVRLWDLVKARDTRRINEFVRLEATNPGDKSWVYEDGLGLAEEAQLKSAGINPYKIWSDHNVIGQHSPDWRPSDVLTLGAAFVRRWINEALNNGVSPVLKPDPDSGELQLVHEPKSLFAALALQFAHAVAGHKKQRQCKECGIWFEVSREEFGFTERRLFCSDPCKSRDYRRRKERAQQLKAEGKSPKSIAEHLDTDLDTIKRWLSKRKG
jgi:hypothetical protein